MVGVVEGWGVVGVVEGWGVVGVVEGRGRGVVEGQGKWRWGMRSRGKGLRRLESHEPLMAAESERGSLAAESEGMSVAEESCVTVKEVATAARSRRRLRAFGRLGTQTRRRRRTFPSRPHLSLHRQRRRGRRSQSSTWPGKARGLQGVQPKVASSLERSGELHSIEGHPCITVSCIPHPEPLQGRRGRRGGGRGGAWRRLAGRGGGQSAGWAGDGALRPGKFARMEWDEREIAGI